MCLITHDVNIKSKLEKDSRKRTLNPEEDELTNVLVQTFQVERAPQQMDLASLNSSELSNLKNDDPFMYYSISAVRSATLRGKNVDTSILRAAPKSLQSSSVDSEGTVTRQRRVSTECHPDLLYGEMFTDHDLMTSLKNLESGSSRSLGNENNLHEDWLFGYLLELNEAR